MQRDPAAASKARDRERKENEKSGLITIKPLSLDAQSKPSSSSGFKKGGFKSAFGEPKEEIEKKSGGGFKKVFGGEEKETVIEPESDTEDEGYEVYDPRYPTG